MQAVIQESSMHVNVFTPNLALTLAQPGDVSALCRLWSLDQLPHAPHAMWARDVDAGLPRRVARLIEWAARVRSGRCGLWCARRLGDSSSVLGCALAWQAPVEPDAHPLRVGVVLPHRAWGLGYALEIARALLRTDVSDDWASGAERFSAAPGSRLLRLSLTELLAHSDVAEVACEPGPSNSSNDSSLQRSVR
jgi:hypothetical protein